MEPDVASKHIFIASMMHTSIRSPVLNEKPDVTCPSSCDIEVFSDNAAALHMVRNGSETACRTRHISVKALWLHQMSRRGIKFTYQPTSEMAADSLTKGLGASRKPQIKEDVCLVED